MHGTTLPVWNLQTGRDLKEYHFKHPSAVKCVKTNETRVFSSCDHGLIKVWDMEKASLIRVRGCRPSPAHREHQDEPSINSVPSLQIITAHQVSVRCLFLDQWHFLSADCDGQVMAWSVKSDAKHCLKIFRHAKYGCLPAESLGLRAAVDPCPLRPPAGRFYL